MSLVAAERRVPLGSGRSGRKRMELNGEGGMLIV